MTRETTSVTTLVRLATIAALLVLPAGRAEGATPTYYDNLPAFELHVTDTVTDDYSNPAYVLVQTNAVMSAVLGETDYTSTGHDDVNIVSLDNYCAGCNGSFELSFQTTTVGTPEGVQGVAVTILENNIGNPYWAFITFADGTTANVLLPTGASFWGVAAPERIERIHFGLSGGVGTTSGYFVIDDLTIGDGSLGLCMVDADCTDDGDICTDQICAAGVCTYPFNVVPCDDAEVCTIDDACTFGVCQGSLMDCDDANPCTTNFCDFGVGCDMIASPGPCDDGNVCTVDDACTEGVCGGVMTICNDRDICTQDSCDPVSGCFGEEIPGCCIGDQDCAEDEACDVEVNACMPLASGSSGTTTSGGGPGETGVDGTSDGGSGGAGEGASSGGVDTGGSGSGSSSSSDGVGTGGGTSDGGGGAPALDPSSCACTNGPWERDGAWWSLVGLAVVRRRRRAGGATVASGERWWWLREHHEGQRLGQRRSVSR